MTMKNSARATLKRALLLGASVIAISGAAHAQDQSKVFDVPAQPATASIPEFAREANIQILVSADDVRGKRTKAIYGNLSVHDALSQLLADTGIMIASDDGRTIVLMVEKKGAAVEPARLAGVMLAQAQQTAPGQMAQAAQAQVPEQVLITGSLIHGTVAVGVPVISLGAQDYKLAGALTTADLLKNVPSVVVQASLTVTQNGGNIEGAQQVEIHGIGGGTTAPKTLMLIDSVRAPIQGHGNCIIDPSIIPALAVDHIDVLADGASATYGSDAIAGVLNVVLKRGFEGAISQVRIGDSTGIGGISVMGSQLYGKKWDTGDITATFESYVVQKVQAPARKYETYDFSIFGLDNRTPLISGHPGIVSTGDPHTPDAAPSGFDAANGTTCDNCYSIPKGQNGVGLKWSSVLANKGVANEINPYVDAWSLPQVTRNALVVTFDQDIWKGGDIIKDVQFFGEGFYNNRRNVIHSAGTTGATDVNSFIQAVPTSNPYYPIGAPDGLQVAYNFDKELQGSVTSGDIGSRYEGGFNINLPSDWKGKIFYSKSDDQQFATFTNMVNSNLAQAAVGIPVDAKGAFAGYSKPANVPYLNLFCDANAFQCNDPATLAYIRVGRQVRERTIFDETGINFDGPVFDLPGGPIRAAVGADYLSNHYSFSDTDGSNSLLGNAAPSLAKDAASETVAAFFAQVNVPIVGKDNAIPLVQSLEIELSGRIDHYSDAGVTKNPKIAVNWNVGAGFSLRGTMGTSFRAPLFQETSAVAGATIDPLNIAGGANGDNQQSCPVVGVPAVPGSAAAILDPHCTAALQFLGGIEIGGGSGAAKQVRPPGFHLNPETARTWAAGFDFAPTDFLKGLDLNFTLYYLKINGVIQPLSLGQGFDDPLARNVFILNTDPNFAKLVAATAALPTAAPQIIPANISFIEDLANQNVGWTSYKGIDFSAQYFWDMEDLGVWNTGVTGNYALDHQTLNVVGAPVFDAYKGLDSGGRLNYRAHLGWTEPSPSAWSVTAFMNYQAHVGNQGYIDDRTPELPPGCFMIGNPACNASGLPQFAQYTHQYALLTNFEPARITFDLSIGYDTGETPANDYLKNLAFQLTINDLTDKPPNFAYHTSVHHGGPRAFDIFQDPAQRVVSFVITKVW